MRKVRVFTAEDVKRHAIAMLRCNLRPMSAAKSLGISYDTLTNRVVRIKEQFGLDLRVYNQCMQAARGGVRLG